MGHYNAGCAKRTKVYSNSAHISALCRGRLTKAQKKKFHIKTSVRTKSGGWQGSKQLKSTQFLGLIGFAGRRDGVAIQPAYSLLFDGVFEVEQQSHIINGQWSSQHPTALYRGVARCYPRRSNCAGPTWE